MSWPLGFCIVRRFLPPFNFYIYGKNLPTCIHGQRLQRYLSNPRNANNRVKNYSIQNPFMACMSSMNACMHVCALHRRERIENGKRSRGTVLDDEVSEVD